MHASINLSSAKHGQMFLFVHMYTYIVIHCQKHINTQIQSIIAIEFGKW